VLQYLRCLCRSWRSWASTGALAVTSGCQPSYLFSSCVVFVRSLIEHSHLSIQWSIHGRGLKVELIFNLGQIHLNLVTDALLPAIFEVKKHVFANVALGVGLHLKLLNKVRQTYSVELRSADVSFLKPRLELFVKLPVFLL